MLAPFSKKPLALTLRGITTDDRDLSVRRPRTSRYIHIIIFHKVDLIRTVTLPHLEPFGITDGLELKVRRPFTHARAHAYASLKIKKRGSPPLGGGEVLFVCPIVKQVKTLNFVETGKIKRIRGIAYATSLLTILTLLKIPCRHAVRVSPQFSNRMIEAARSVLNRYIPDIYLYSDVYKGEESGK